MRPDLDGDDNEAMTDPARSSRTDPPRAVRRRHRVGATDTAAAVGSGEVDVLATPRLIAWLEGATVSAAAPFLAAGETTVGSAIRIGHRRPTRVGDSVEVVAEPPEAPDGRRLVFTVRAVDDDGELVAAGEIERVIIQRSRFPG